MKNQNHFNAVAATYTRTVTTDGLFELVDAATPDGTVYVMVIMTPDGEIHYARSDMTSDEYDLIANVASAELTRARVENRLREHEATRKTAESSESDESGSAP